MSVHTLVNHPEDRSAVIDKIAVALRQTMVETAKAQTYHWNVTGIAFAPLHALFQEIYEDHFAAQDALAERIKALGGHADGRLSKAVEENSIDECAGAISAEAMVATLSEDQRTIARTMTSLVQLAERSGDAVTADLATERAMIHEKFAWMLAAHLGS